jgi:hypothetical protein
MNKQSNSQRRREITVLAALSGLCGASIFCYSFLLGGTWFLAFFGMLAILLLIGVFNYLIWGKQLEEETRSEAAEAIDPDEAGLVQSNDGYSFYDSLYPPADSWWRCSLDDLPPAIRKRMQGSLSFRPDNEDLRRNRYWWE